MADNRHPDHAWQERMFGCAHTTGGRVMPAYRIAAAFDDPTGWRNSQSVRPSPIATQGASAYHSLSGISEPAPVDFSRSFRTPESVSTVGRAYDALPTYQPEAVPHFAAMQKEVHDQYHHMTHNLGINVTSVDQDPYPDVHHMMSDVNNNRRLQVLGTHATGGHPFFDDDTNDKFRAVHDFYGHAGTGRGFDRHGEEAAFIKHAGMFSPAARPALTSEARGQNSSLILNGGFGPQKVATMDPRMMTAKGDPSYLKPGKCEYCKDPAARSILHSEGMAYVQTCDKHLAKGKDAASACVPYGDPDPSNIDKIYDLGTKKVIESAHLNQRTSSWYHEDDFRHPERLEGTRPIVRHPDGSTQELSDWVHQASLADWTHDPQNDWYTHPSGHVIKPSEDKPGTHQLWAPTVSMSRRSGPLAKDRAPTSDLQKHFDWVDYTEGTGQTNPYSKRRPMSQRILTAREQVEMLEPWTREAVDTSCMPPDSHAYHQPPGEGQGEHNPWLRQHELTPDQERAHEGVSDDDESGYNWGPEPSFRQAADHRLSEDDMDRLMEQAQGGGYTFRDHPGDGPKAGQGVMVSIPGHERTHEEGPTRENQHKFLDDTVDTVHAAPDLYPGGWKNPKGFTNDLSKRHDDPWEASGAALGGHQDAVYDYDGRWHPKGEPSAVDTPEFVHDQIAKGGSRWLTR